MRENIIAVKSYDFAVMIVNLSRNIVRQREYVILKQILKSGTSIGANIEEARETHYWLRILKDTNYIESLSLQKSNYLSLIIHTNY